MDVSASFTLIEASRPTRSPGNALISGTTLLGTSSNTAIYWMKTSVARAMDPIRDVQGLSNVNEAVASVSKPVPIYFHSIAHGGGSMVLTWLFSRPSALWAVNGLHRRLIVLRVVYARFSCHLEWQCLSGWSTGINQHRGVRNLPSSCHPAQRCERDHLPDSSLSMSYDQYLQVYYHHRSHVHRFHARNHIWYGYCDIHGDSSSLHTMATYEKHIQLEKLHALK